MVRIKIAEALRLIRERDKARNASANRARQKERLTIRYQHQKEYLRWKREKSKPSLSEQKATTKE